MTEKVVRDGLKIRSSSETEKNAPPSTTGRKISLNEIGPSSKLNSTGIGDANSGLAMRRDFGNSNPIQSRFADYFVICGLDLDTGLEPDRFTGDSLHCSPLDRAYKSKPLAHYPENVPWNPFDAHGICMLSLPQGLRFRTQKHNIEPRYHSFATTREDGKRCHGFSLVFYEEVRNPSICNAIHTLQAMFITELSSSQPMAALRRVQEGPVSRSLPRHFKLADTGSAASYYDIQKDKLYVAKSISLICQVPYAYAAEIFLKNLYKCLPRQPGAGLSLESYVYNILHEVILPAAGKSIQIYLPPEEPNLPPVPIILQRPGLYNELPLLDFPLSLLFSYLRVESIIQLFTCVLLENQVLLRSDDYQKLMIVGECITALLLPFNWPHVYAPILPAALHHFLDAPVPFVMGLHAECEINAKLGSEATLCLVDIDKKIIQLPEELPLFPHKTDFMAEIISVLDKFDIERDKVTEPVTILNPKTFYQKEYDLMTTSCTLPSGLHVRRKQSMHESIHENWNHLNETHHQYHSANAHIFGSQQSQLQSQMYNGPPKSEAIQRIVDMTKKNGIQLDDIGLSADMTMSSSIKKQQQDRQTQQNQGNQQKPPQSLQEKYCDDQRFNNSVREIFLNRFVHMFACYEQFVILPNQDKEEWLTNRESLQNFDKASFLSDQPEHHRPFLSRFLESQMFATLIDNKIMAVWDKDIDPNLKLFDSRIQLLRKRHGGDSVIRATSYEPCVLSQETQRILDKRLTSVDVEVTPPSEILKHRPACFRGFPILEKSVLNQECSSRGNSLRRVKNGSSKWKAKDIPLDSKPPLFPNANHRSTSANISEMSPALIAQANWTFVEKLLKDIKSKTKRMLLEKMGNEAVALGLSGEVTVVGVEENTLIASLCDLLEKIWSHGLQNKQGKSALWSHLQAYLELQERKNNTTRQIDTNYPTPAVAWSVMRKRMDYLATFTLEPESPASPTRGRSHERKDSNLEQLRPLPESLDFDIKNVLAMTDIKTHIGYTRAWVRLSLEKKLLSRHFRTFLSDTGLLRSLYKRSAFLRCEEEKEQFLYHLLTLNTVDYFCFTNTYPTAKLPYRVVIFSSRKFGCGTTTSNVWVAISGTMGESQHVAVPKGTQEFIFHHKNLGILTTMRIGHDNSGPSTKWMVEHVVIRNEVTGHTYKFPCGRWLGKGIDDGSTERLLVGQRLPQNVDNEELVQVCRTPPRARSPSTHRSELRPSEIQHMLGDCVNTIVKWHYKPSRDRDVGTFTNLLCGEEGLVKCLEQAFLYGFRSSRLFGRNLYIWDYFLKVKDQFDINLNGEQNSVVEYSGRYDSCSISPPSSSGSGGSTDSSRNRGISPTPSSPITVQRNEIIAIWRCYSYLIDEINTVTNTLGKDGKFQLFICLCLREHILNRMLPLMSATKVTQEMYEEQSFLRRKGLLTFLIQILEPLDEFHIMLENSITHGIPSQC